MEKPKPKQKKRKIIQITYPAPYSHSWTPDVQPLLMKNKVGVTTSHFHRSRRPAGCSRAWRQEFSSDRPDPTAPHLKYGVFRNRRGAAKPLPQIDTYPKMDRFKYSPAPMKRVKSKTTPVPKLPKVIGKGYPMKAPMKPVGKVSVHSVFPPKFVFQHTETNSRNLAYSKISHLDIKPKIIAPFSPSFCPTPNFRGIPRRLTVSPTRYRSNEALKLV